MTMIARAIYERVSSLEALENVQDFVARAASMLHVARGINETRD
jgi:hypothetical protein